MRFPFLLALLAAALLLGWGRASAQTGEAIVLTGGPALRYMEHGKEVSHDFYWFNFVDASVIRLRELQGQVAPGTQVTWLVFRPGYVARSEEMGRNLLPEIQAKARKLGANLLYFDTKEQVINYLNSGRDRAQARIVSFDYFGHSNKACFLFDYSNAIDGMSVTFLHVDDLAKVNRGVFAPNAACKSWGCHSGELYSQEWRKRFSVAMTGAVGKTDFSHGGLPMLSNAQGKWVQ